MSTRRPTSARSGRRWRVRERGAFFMRVACRRVVPSREAASGAAEARRWAALKRSSTKRALYPKTRMVEFCYNMLYYYSYQ